MSRVPRPVSARSGLSSGTMEYAASLCGDRSSLGQVRTDAIGLLAHALHPTISTTGCFFWEKQQVFDNDETTPET